MVDSKFRKAISEYANERDLEIIILDNHAYDNSVVGVTEDGRLVYDYDKMVEEFMQDEECDELDAIEWLDYNTMRALPYLGDNGPIIIQTTKDSLMELYGED